MRMFKILVCLVLAYQINAQKLKVISSASIFQDMAYNIGGDLFDYDMIVPVGGDPHLHEPTPRDARAVASADLVLVNGLTFEGWINELIENSGTKAKIVTITEGLNVLTSEKYKDSTDPHAWMTAKNGQVYIQNIKNALIELMPDAKDQFEKNYLKYEKQLMELDLYIKSEILKIPVAQRILITSHDAFSYYGNYYGILNDAILGVSTDAEIQTSDIRRINKIIKEQKIPSIFVESTINPKVMKQIAKDNNVKIGGKLYADSLGPAGSPGDTYINMLKHNTDALVQGLLNAEQIAEESEVTGEKSSNLLWVYLLLGFVLIGSLVFAMMKLSKL